MHDIKLFKEERRPQSDTMVVMASCKNCGKEFRLTAVRIDKEHDLKSSTFANVSETCPNCGEMNTYSVKNTIWRDE